jgi:DNA-binding transcriptional MerR regulator
MKTSYSIGEFSKVTGLSVKTLRFYHEKGILVPSSVDDTSGYRFYDESKVEKARVIMQLRAMEFSLEDIAAVLGECADEADVLNYLERQKEILQQLEHRSARFLECQDADAPVHRIEGLSPATPRRTIPCARPNPRRCESRPEVFGEEYAWTQNERLSRYDEGRLASLVRGAGRHVWDVPSARGTCGQRPPADRWPTVATTNGADNVSSGR